MATTKDTAPDPEPQRDEVSTQEGEAENPHDGPSSSETCGRFPAQEVAQTFPGQGTDPQSAPQSSESPVAPQGADPQRRDPQSPEQSPEQSTR